MATIPSESVRFRTGAVLSRETVDLLEESATKENAKEASGRGVGLDLETVLSVRARISAVAGPRYGWLDLHVFDGGDQLIHSDTLPLSYVGAADDDGDLFGFDGNVYRGTGASPGSVWLAPDARKVQFRLYCEVHGTVFTDGVLRQHELPADSAFTHCGSPQEHAPVRVVARA